MESGLVLNIQRYSLHDGPGIRTTVFLKEWVSGLRSVTLVNVLSFHRTGVHKFERLGLTHALDGVETPSPELMLAVVEQFHSFGLKTRVGG